MTTRFDIRVQREDFDLAAECAMLSGDAAVGAVVTFSGICRDEDGALAGLELEHYPGMAEAEITRICKDASARWPLAALTVIHRTGLMRPGENIVLVAAASAQRQAAFAAAEFVMDFLKSRAPFWKMEHRRDGADGEWVSARESDDAALSRWSAGASQGGPA